MARIPEHIIESVRQAADIYDVVSEHVDLKKNGRNFKGLCPFHNEKTPSFHIHMDKQIYKCFGCGKGGGSINFIMQIEKLDFLDAVKFLGQKHNIPIELEHNSKSSNDLFNQLYTMHEFAKSFYEKNMNDKVRKLLNDRNINDNSIKIFEIGLSNQNYDELLKIFREQKFSSEALNKSGLFINHEKGYMDRFRNRIMFPIYNQFNKPIAFGGRIFNNETQTAKYLNSSDSPIYNKSRTLYGINVTKNDIIEKEYAIIVEGYMDLIQLYQAGIKNVLSVSGTSFTDQHATMISKMCKTIYIAYDGDEAGINSAIRAGYTLLKNNLEGKIIAMPKGLDPDDLIQKEGKESFDNHIKSALSVIEFHYKNKIDNDSSERKKIEFIKDAILELSVINDDLIVESLVKELSYLSGFSAQSIFSSIEKNKKTTRNKITASQETINSKNNEESISLIDKELIMFCFSESLESRTLIKNHLQKEWIRSISIRNIYEQIYLHLTSEEVVKPEIVLQELKIESERDLMSGLLFNNDKIEMSKSKIINCLSRMEKNYIQLNLNHLREKLKNSHPDENDELLTKITDLQKQKNSLKNKYANL